MAGSVELAYDAVKGEIMSGSRPGGSRLREEELADALGISRTPVREALRRLHSEGLVDVSPNRGAQVAHWDDDDLDDVFGLRALVEGYAARRAATHVAECELAELAGLCARMGDVLAGNLPFEEATEINLRFHRIIHGAARSTRLVVTLGSLIEVPLVHHTFARYSSEEMARSHAHHRELVVALEARNPDWAEAVMRAHVQAARSSLRRARGERPEAVAAIAAHEAWEGA